MNCKIWPRRSWSCDRSRAIYEAITQVKYLTDFKHERYDKGKNIRSSHAKGGRDRGRVKEQEAHPKQYDFYKLNGKQ